MITLTDDYKQQIEEMVNSIDVENHELSSYVPAIQPWFTHTGEPEDYDDDEYLEVQKRKFLSDIENDEEGYIGWLDFTERDEAEYLMNPASRDAFDNEVEKYIENM